MGRFLFISQGRVRMRPNQAFSLKRHREGPDPPTVWLSTPNMCLFLCWFLSTYLGKTRSASCLQYLHAAMLFHIRAGPHHLRWSKRSRSEIMACSSTVWPLSQTGVKSIDLHMPCEEAGFSLLPKNEDRSPVMAPVFSWPWIRKYLCVCVHRLPLPSFLLSFPFLPLSLLPQRRREQ